MIILQPSGEMLQSPHTCNLKIPWLPAEMQKAHIVPGLVHTTLISIRQFCKAGAEVLFDGNACYVLHRGRIVLKGTINKQTDLWDLPIAPTEPLGMPDTEGVWDNKNFGAYAGLFVNMTAVNGDIKITTKKQLMNNAYTIRSARARIKYIHQCLFYPPIPTLLDVVQRGYLKLWTGLTVHAVNRYLTESPATAKGHMKLRRQYTRSGSRPTRLSKQQQEKIREIVNGVEDNNDSVDGRVNHLFCHAALTDKQENTVYMDLEVPVHLIRRKSMHVGSV